MAMAGELRVRWSGGEAGWVAGRCVVAGCGGAGQLAAELLAASLRLRVAARGLHAALPPLAASGAEPMRLLADRAEPVTSLLFRAAPAGRLATELVEQMGGFLDVCDPALVFIVTTADASENSRPDSTVYRYLANEYVDDIKDLAKMGWKDFAEEKPDGVIFGAKFAQGLFAKCTELDIPCIILFKYCYEGIHMDTAVDLLKQANRWVKAIKCEDHEFSRKLVYPVSWKFTHVNPVPNLF